MVNKHSWKFCEIKVTCLEVHYRAATQSVSLTRDKYGNGQQGCCCGWIGPWEQSLKSQEIWDKYIFFLWIICNVKERPSTIPSLELSMWFGHLFTTSCRFVDPLNTATALKTVPDGGCIRVLNLIGQKLARLTYNFLQTSEYVQVADLDADSVKGPNESSNPQSPGYSVVLGMVGKRACM